VFFIWSLFRKPPRIQKFCCVIRTAQPTNIKGHRCVFVVLLKP
jgi:hypothetical protein